ncbi:hypothetical protein SAMN05660350_00527 [Geodermatophilus obscurus]|uniref:Uncharacterized protein n=1 Tax=Geodermatophilus obscurus TaxID=1861 RepID=A0A1M7S934_9ACTN|nr:hypothetical protein SAMN05660350_00527 [Geodermatophilus obscurus]
MVVGEGEADRSTGWGGQADGVELGEQLAHVRGGDRHPRHRAGGLRDGAGPGECGRRRGAAGEEPAGGERAERDLDVEVRGHRLGGRPGPRDQVGQHPGPQHAQWPVVAGLLGPPRRLVDPRLAGGGQFVGHAGDQLADAVAHRPAAHGHRLVGVLARPVGRGGIPGGQLGAQPVLQPADGQRRRLRQHRGLHLGEHRGVGAAHLLPQLLGHGAGGWPVQPAPRQLRQRGRQRLRQRQCVLGEHRGRRPGAGQRQRQLVGEELRHTFRRRIGPGGGTRFTGPAVEEGRAVGGEGGDQFHLVGREFRLQLLDPLQLRGLLRRRPRVHGQHLGQRRWGGDRRPELRRRRRQVGHRQADAEATGEHALTVGRGYDTSRL